MQNKKLNYITALRNAILKLHKSWSIHVRTIHVHETFEGKTVWEGDVEVFKMTEHPAANRVYAWAKLEGQNDETTKFVTVLEIPPVKDARTAVQASIMADSPKPQS